MWGVVWRLERNISDEEGIVYRTGFENRRASAGCPCVKFSIVASQMTFLYTVCYGVYA